MPLNLGAKIRQWADRPFNSFRECRMMVEKLEDAPTEESAAMVSHGDRRAHQKAIGQGLKKFFNAVAAEPIPEEFLVLLQKLDDRKEGGSQ
jgi:hypothetical protein